MQLLTDEIKAQLPNLYATDKQEEKTAVCKFFNPAGAGTWYAVEGEEQPDGDWLFFGLVELLDREWGYFSLNELQSVGVGFGLGS